MSPYTSPLLKGNPYIDVVLTDNPNQGEGGHSFIEKVKEIRSYRFDTALLLMPTKRTAYMLFLAGIPYRVGVGRILYEVVTFMHGVSRRKYHPLRHESDYMLDLARKIGAEKLWMRPEVFIDEEERAVARRFLQGKEFETDKPVVAIHPGSGRSAPNWAPGRYRQLAEIVLDGGAQVLITGSESERTLADAFTASGNRGIQSSFGELSLRELAAVLSEVTLLVSSSTGPMHIASAVGTPTVSMFCPLPACSPKLWGPLGNSATIILPEEGFCMESCPQDPHVCTFGSGDEGIAVQKVFEAVKNSLNKMESAYDNSTGLGQRR